MLKLAVFAVSSAGLIFISRASLRAPRSHGFYRFFAWELILALFLINVDDWFRDPFSWHQLISWFLLIVCLVPLIFGVRSLIARGRPAKHREDDAHLMGIEKTTTLVTTGIYRYIRHPMYCSLLLLAWGIFFKAPGWPGALLALAASLLLFVTAKTDEAECIRYFGSSYRTYMRQTKMFVPYLF